MTERICENPACGRPFEAKRGARFCCKSCTPSARAGAEAHAALWRTSRTTPRARVIAALTSLGGSASWTVLLGRSGCTDPQLRGACTRLVSEGVVEWDTYDAPITDRRVRLA